MSEWKYDFSDSVSFIQEAPPSVATGSEKALKQSDMLHAGTLSYDKM